MGAGVWQRKLITWTEDPKQTNNIPMTISTNRQYEGFAHSSVGKESTCSAGDLGSVPGLGRSPGERNGYPLQYSCLENSMDRGAYWAR